VRPPRPTRAATHRGEPEFLYLTTIGRRSGRPRRIEIWFTSRDGRDYVIAETGHAAHWVQNLLADPRVRWRVGRRTRRGRARILDSPADAAMRRAAQARSRQKYGWGAALVVELTPEA
jgi:deazaflavin-dependent oxidoreductase (nitroreductase family)